MPNVQENCRKKIKENVSENEEKSIEECSGAYECRAAAAENRSSLPKVQGKRKRNEIKGGKREAVRVGWKVIRSRLSCAGGRVEREGESRGEKRDEMTKGKRRRMRGRRALRHGSFCSDPSVNTRQSLH